MKSWTTRQGKIRVGGAFDRAALVRLVTNVVYTGEAKHHGTMYAGEQAAIIEPKIWKHVNDLLREGNRGKEKAQRNRHGRC